MFTPCTDMYVVKNVVRWFDKTSFDWLCENPPLTHIQFSTAVTIHWTGLLDWNTGLDYWTEVFSFLQNYVVFQIFDTWRPQLETIEFL